MSAKIQGKHQITAAALAGICEMTGLMGAGLEDANSYLAQHDRLRTVFLNVQSLLSPHFELHEIPFDFKVLLKYYPV